jgi:hypothetical protein
MNFQGQHNFKSMMATLFFLCFFAAFSHTEIKPQLAQQCCDPAKELQAVLLDYDRALEGVAGVNCTHGRGEVWVSSKTGKTYFNKRKVK